MGHRKPTDWDARFLSRLVPQANGCLLYEGPGIGDGRYGCIWTGKPERAHRYAWRRKNGPIPADVRVLHRCDNPRCCEPSHLFLGTDSDNMQDMIRKSRGLHGERHPTHKLTAADVQAIRADLRSQAVIAAEYGINQATVSKIKRRKKWAHL